MRRPFRLAPLLPLALAALSPSRAAAQDLLGHWEGEMVQQGSRLAVTLDFARGPAGITATWSAPSMRALEIPLASVRFEGQKAHFELVGDQNSTVFEGELRRDSIAGRFSGGEGEGTFAFARVTAPALPYREEEVRFANGSVRLAGTLLIPLRPGRHAAVVFVHGSGPEGRFGARFLAVHLARHGVGALIFDKRGVGASGGDWHRASLEDLADDAIAGVRLLRARAEIDPARIGIYGHSQGGLVAPLAVTRSTGIAFLIAGGTYGGDVYEQDLYRVENSLRSSGFSEADQRIAMTFYRRFIEVARSGRGENIDALLHAGDSVRTQAWYQWLGIPPRDHWLWTFYPPIGNFNPLPIWSRVKVPVLLLYGQEDRLVAVDSSIGRIGRALDAAGNRLWAAAILPRAAHNFTVSPPPGAPFEWRHVANGLPEFALGWIRVQTEPN